MKANNQPIKIYEYMEEMQSRSGDSIWPIFSSAANDE